MPALPFSEMEDSPAEYTSSSQVVVKIDIRNQRIVVVNAMTGRVPPKGSFASIEKPESISTVPV